MYVCADAAAMKAASRGGGGEAGMLGKSGRRGSVRWPRGGRGAGGSVGRRPQEPRASGRDRRVMTGWEAEGSNSPRGGCYGQAEPLRTLQASLGGGGVQRRPVTPSTGFIHSGGGVLSPIPCTRATPGCQGNGGEGRPTAEEDGDALPCSLVGPERLLCPGSPGDASMRGERGRPAAEERAREPRARRRGGWGRRH